MLHALQPFMINRFDVGNGDIEILYRYANASRVATDAI